MEQKWSTVIIVILTIIKEKKKKTFNNNQKIKINHFYKNIMLNIIILQLNFKENITSKIIYKNFLKIFWNIFYYKINISLNKQFVCIRNYSSDSLIMNYHKTILSNRCISKLIIFCCHIFRMKNFIYLKW